MEKSARRPNPITRTRSAFTFWFGESRALVPRSPVNFPRARRRESAPSRIQSTRPRRPRGAGSSSGWKNTRTSVRISSRRSSASRAAMSGGGPGGRTQVKADLVQDPVDESPRFLTAVLLRQFYGLVDGDTLGDIVPEEEFVRRQA